MLWVHKTLFSFSCVQIECFFQLYLQLSMCLDYRTQVVVISVNLSLYLRFPMKPSLIFHVRCLVPMNSSEGYAAVDVRLSLLWEGVWVLQMTMWNMNHHPTIHLDCDIWRNNLYCVKPLRCFYVVLIAARLFWIIWNERSKNEKYTYTYAMFGQYFPSLLGQHLFQTWISKIPQDTNYSGWLLADNSCLFSRTFTGSQNLRMTLYEESNIRGRELDN